VIDHLVASCPTSLLAIANPIQASLRIPDSFPIQKKVKFFSCSIPCLSRWVSRRANHVCLCHHSQTFNQLTLFGFVIYLRLSNLTLLVVMVASHSCLFAPRVCYWCLQSHLLVPTLSTVTLSFTLFVSLLCSGHVHCLPFMTVSVHLFVRM